MSFDQPQQQSQQHRRKRWIVVMLVAFAAGLIVLFTIRDREPRFEGKTISQWLSEIDTGRFDVVDFRPVADAEAIRAIEAIGERAVPFLISYLDSALAAEMSFYDLQDWPTKLPFRIMEPRLDRRIIKGRQALMALQVLGRQGKCSLQQLLAIKPRHDTQQHHLLIAAASAGPAATTLISNALFSGEYWAEEGAIDAAGMLGTNAVAFVPKLISILESPDNSHATFAARSLGRIGEPSHLVLPALQRALDSTNALIAGNAALGLMLAGMRDEETVRKLASRARRENGKPNTFVLLSLVVLVTNDTELVSLLERSPGMNRHTTRPVDQVFTEVRRTWTNCDSKSRREMFSMLNDLIPQRGTN